MYARRARDTDITTTSQQEAPMAFPAPAVPLAYSSISIALYAWNLVAIRHKWFCLVLLLCFQYLALATSNHWPHNGMDSLWGLTVCIWISRSYSVLFLEDQSLLVNPESHPRSRSWYWKGWKTWNNIRLLGIRRAENCTPQSFYGCRSRSVFAVIRIGKLMVYWVLIRFVQPLIMPGAFIPFQQSDFDEVRQTYFRRIFSDQDPITIRETILRATFAVFWAWSAYIMLEAAHSALSILFVVVVRVDEPHQWPPIFGDLRKASSLRGFWGQFWHRLVVLSYSNYGRFVAENILGLRPGSRRHKLVVAFDVFLISGVAHSVVAWQLGDRCGWHLDFCWFCLNFLVSAVEGAVWSSSTRKAATARSFPFQRLELIARECLGFVWVFAFFFWSVPKWQYRKAHCLLKDIASAGGEQ